MGNVSENKANIAKLLEKVEKEVTGIPSSAGQTGIQGGRFQDFQFLHFKKPPASSLRLLSDHCQDLKADSELSQEAEQWVGGRSGCPFGLALSSFVLASPVRTYTMLLKSKLTQHFFFNVRRNMFSSRADWHHLQMGFIINCS